MKDNFKRFVVRKMFERPLQSDNYLLVLFYESEIDRIIKDLRNSIKLDDYSEFFDKIKDLRSKIKELKVQD